MLHPSYTDLMNIINEDNVEGKDPAVTSRYSIVIAIAKRSRQLIDKAKPLTHNAINKPVSIAVQEMYERKVKLKEIE